MERISVVPTNSKRLATGGGAMTAPTESDRLALLYKYAYQLTMLVSSGRITRERLGRSQMD